MTKHDALRRKFRALISELVDPLVDELLEKVRARFEAALSGGRPPIVQRDVKPAKAKRRKPATRAKAKPPTSKPKAAIAPQIEKQTAPVRNLSPAREPGTARPCGCAGSRGQHRSGCVKRGATKAAAAIKADMQRDFDHVRGAAPIPRTAIATIPSAPIATGDAAAKRRAEILARAKARQS